MRTNLEAVKHDMTNIETRLNEPSEGTRKHVKKLTNTFESWIRSKKSI